MGEPDSEEDLTDWHTIAAATKDRIQQIIETNPQLERYRRWVSKFSDAVAILPSSRRIIELRALHYITKTSSHGRRIEATAAAAVYLAAIDFLGVSKVETKTFLSHTCSVSMEVFTSAVRDMFRDWENSRMIPPRLSRRFGYTRDELRAKSWFRDKIDEIAERERGIKWRQTA